MAGIVWQPVGIHFWILDFGSELKVPLSNPKSKI